MDLVCVRVNESKRTAEEQKRQFNTLVELQSKMKPKEMVKDLVVEGRSLLKQFNLIRFDQHANKRREVVFFLFSDLVLVAKEKRGGKTERKTGKTGKGETGLGGGKFLCVFRANLKDGGNQVKVEIMADNPNFMGQEVKNAFVLHTPRESFLFFCPTIDDRNFICDYLVKTLPKHNY